MCLAFGSVGELWILCVSVGGGGFGHDNPMTALCLVAILLSIGVGWFATVLFPPSAKRDSKEHIFDYPELIWSDEFDGDSVDLTKWTFVNGNGCDVGLCGWGNNELEWYTPSNAQVTGGRLIIEARKFVTPDSPASYTSSKIISRGKADFGVVGTDGVDMKSSNALVEQSRRFESRLRLPWGNGIWPAFWMLPTHDTYGGWPKVRRFPLILCQDVFNAKFVLFLKST